MGADSPLLRAAMQTTPPYTASSHSLESLARRTMPEPSHSGSSSYLVPSASSTAPLVAPSKRDLNVLVADDNALNGIVAQRFVVRAGHRCRVVMSGREAFEAWEAAWAAGEPYDVLLLDLHMPDMDGIEATRAIRAQETARNRKRVPLFALTAADSGEVAACIEAGMDSFLSKPITFAALAKILEKTKVA